MTVTTKSIVLSAIKYGDTSLIVKAFTASDGVKSYLLRGVLTSRKGKVRAGLFQPLTQIEIVANHKNKGTLERIREAKVMYPYKTLHTEIVKNSIVLFLAEILSNVIQEEEKNIALFNYLEYSLRWLDTSEQVTNFHLLFLIQLTSYLGFYPDVTDQELPYFDLLEGGFINRPSLNPILDGDLLHYFKRFLGINFDAVFSIKMTKPLRQQLLKKVLLYFELHLHGFRTPRSLAILNAVFN
ncbi:MAG: DNA repair protein RecO [Bacteroidota bacterium]